MYLEEGSARKASFLLQYNNSQSFFDLQNNFHSDEIIISTDFADFFTLFSPIIIKQILCSKNIVSLNGQESLYLV